MNISYKRTANTSYMIIDQGILPNGYEEQMLKENDIASLLPFYTTVNNGNLSYWYDISGKISLVDYYKRSGINRDTLLNVFRGLSVALHETAKYLIPQEHILITAETVYLKENGSQPTVYLCFYPDRDNPGGMMALMEHLITVVDHGMEQERRLCYELYDMSLMPETTISSIIEKIQDEEIPPSIITESSDRCIQVRMRSEQENIKDSGSEKEASTDVETIQENDPGSIFERLLSSVKKLFKRPVFAKKDRLFHDEVTDLIYEPDACIYEPTMMIGRKDMRIEGRLIYEGNGTGEDITITGDECRIGSMPGENDAVIRSPAVSRHHALITVRDGAYYVQDENSTNGTFINEELLAYHEPVKLSYSDRIRFADRSYRFV